MAAGEADLAAEAQASTRPSSLLTALKTDEMTPVTSHDLITYALDKFHDLAAKTVALKPRDILPESLALQTATAGYLLRDVVRLECVKNHFEALAQPLGKLLEPELKADLLSSDLSASQQGQLDDDNEEELGRLERPAWHSNPHWEAMPRFLQFAAAYPNATYRLCRSSRARAGFSLSKLRVQLLAPQAPVTFDMDSIVELTADVLKISAEDAKRQLLDLEIVKKKISRGVHHAKDVEHVAADDVEEPQFRGTIHCEAVLASLIHLAANDNQVSTSSRNPISPFKHAKPIFGISKICCPCCAELLRLLGDKRFIHRGQHANFYTCSLPEELPLEVLQYMVHFAKWALQTSLWWDAVKESTADMEGKRSSSSYASSGSRPTADIEFYAASQRMGIKEDT